ncbi:MAG TPA: PEP-utilizing enzyme [Elusimicrobiales bacterium]|nr:PEP-utilizing enzyme [Elusimicrobiales bacterium]
MKIYDNSNIAESYSGVTTPLTYSFARAVYQEVYVHFCGMMGVSGGVVSRNRAMFAKMVEFIGGRMYYDLINWYKLVSFLPGYSFNRAFFEKMLGLQKEYHYTPPAPRGALLRYGVFLPRLLFQTLKITVSFIFMGPLVRRFNRRFDREYARLSALDLGGMSATACRDLYYRVYNEFVARWQVPIANDFAVMVSAGAADKLYRSWLGGENGYVQLFARSRRPLVSLDPGYQIIKIVALLEKDLRLLELFAPANAPALILRELRGPLAQAAAAREINSYLEKFGSRAPNELKLESRTINEQPEFFISILQGALAAGGAAGAGAQGRDAAPGGEASALSAPRRLLLAAVSRWAVNSVYLREETRFRRSLIFGFTRKLFLALGEKLRAKGFIGETGSVFYLTIEEVFALIDADSAPEGLARAIARRKTEYAYWKDRELPRRIESELPVSGIEAELRGRGAAAQQAPGGTLKGVTAARTRQEKVSGTALVLADFDPAADFTGKILVTRQTDPGWTIVFPLLKGLIVERGGMLSHAAIVARELRIPCIVGAEGAVAGVAQGALVEMRMNSGEVHVLPVPAAGLS